MTTGRLKNIRYEAAEPGRICLPPSSKISEHFGTGSKLAFQDFEPVNILVQLPNDNHDGCYTYNPLF